VAQGQLDDARQQPLRARGGPAAYATLAANEAEKAANITIVEVRAVGRYGRVFLSGSESEVQSARDAAVFALEQIDGTS